MAAEREREDSRSVFIALFRFFARKEKGGGVGGGFLPEKRLVSGLSSMQRGLENSSGGPLLPTGGFQRQRCRHTQRERDRKSGVQGKSVDLGGSRIIKKKR